MKKEIPDVDEYFGTTEMPSLLKHLGADYKHELIGERLLTTPKNYAYLKISEGCDRPCSFCAIPLMRGKHKSVSIKDLVSQAKILAEKGIKELILIAQDSTYYGIDLYGTRSLSKLLKELVKVDGIEWIRLHYAFPNGFPVNVLEVINSEPKICNYIDIPLQHISNKILKSMKRGASMEKINDLLQMFRDKVPEIAIRTTLIVGYPGETNEDFQDTMNIINEVRYDESFSFIYSPRPNTTASDMEDDVTNEEKKERLKILENVEKIIFVSEWVRERFFQNIDQKLQTKTEVVYPSVNKQKKIKKEKNINNW